MKNARRLRGAFLGFITVHLPQSLKDRIVMRLRYNLPENSSHCPAPGGNIGRTSRPKRPTSGQVFGATCRWPVMHRVWPLRAPPRFAGLGSSNPAPEPLQAAEIGQVAESAIARSPLRMQRPKPRRLFSRQVACWPHIASNRSHRIYSALDCPVALQSPKIRLRIRAKRYALRNVAEPSFPDADSY